MTALEPRPGESNVAGLPESRTSRTGTGNSTGTVEQTLAMLALIALGPRLAFHAGVSYGLLFVLLAAPLWVASFAHFRSARFIALGMLFTAGWGYYLARVHALSHLVSAANARDETVQLVGMVVGIGAVLWARRILTTSQIGVCFGIGLLLDTVISPSSTSNPWKFVYAIPVTIVVLGFVARSARPALGVTALIVLAGVSFVLDCRAYSTALLLAALLTTWRSLPRRPDRSRAWPVTASMIAAIALAVYFLIQSLLVNGFLGAAAQERSIEQINMSGSLILGGRPELEAALALFRHDPAGFGVGVVPSAQDILVAKSGLTSVNYQPNNGYVEKYMFGGHIELHSIAGDMWANWGLAGLALVIGLAVLAVRGLAISIAQRSGQPLTIFLCCWTLWCIAFSPLAASVPVIVLTVGMVLRPRTVTDE